MEEPCSPEHTALYGGKWNYRVIKLLHGQDPRHRQTQERGFYFGHKGNRNPERTVVAPWAAGVSTPTAQDSLLTRLSSSLAFQGRLLHLLTGANAFECPRLRVI